MNVGLVDKITNGLGAIAAINSFLVALGIVKPEVAEIVYGVIGGLGFYFVGKPVLPAAIGKSEVNELK